MKSNKQGFAPVQIIVMIVLTLGVAGTGWYLLQAKNKTDITLDATSRGVGNATKTVKKEETKPITTPVDPYAGWKTYTSKYDRMSFKYPADMVLADTSHASVSGQDNVTPGIDTIKLTSTTGFSISIQAGLEGIGGGCPDCQSKFSDPVTINSKSFFMNYIDSGAGNIQNIAVASDAASFIGNLGTQNITITGTSNKAGTIISGSFRDASDNIVGKTLADYKADHFVAEFKLLLQSINY